MQPKMPSRRLAKSLYLLPFILVVGLWVAPTTAQAYDALEECMALSQIEQDIHNCLDNYLDIMDDNIRDISEFIAADLDGDTLAGFEQSQQAFFDYRKTNCLWYLGFSAPRQQAEYIAKNCLARMSQARLSELQSLIAGEKAKNLQRGFYVFGANRNSFQPCGSNDRYWVEGENGMLGQLQQDYLEIATTDLQIIFASVSAKLKKEPGLYTDHAGSATVSAIAELRVPRESDCALSAASGAVATRAEVVAPVVEAEPVQEEVVATPDEPEQLLRAYFGEWLAECKQAKNDYSCKLSVAFTPSDGGGIQPSLFLNRTTEQRTTLDLVFPEIEIDDPQKILWSVDGYTFGQLQGSKILVDESQSLQQMRERKFIRDELMPLMREGSLVGVEVLESLDDESGKKYQASLKGISRAIAFADDFISSGGSL